MRDRAFSHQETIISKVQRDEAAQGCGAPRMSFQERAAGGQDCHRKVSRGLGWSREHKPEETLGSRQARLSPTARQSQQSFTVTTC